MLNNNQGITPKIWGPHAWVFLHSMTFNYPENPTVKEMEQYKTFFMTLADTLPCEECKESYKKFISTGITKLDSNALKNRDSLTKWLYYIHEAVNSKLGVNYGVSFKDVVDKYEAFRAECSNPSGNPRGKHQDSPGQCTQDAQSKTAKSYKVDSIKECPIIPIKMARHFINYAKMRNLDPKEYFFINKIRQDCKEDPNLWAERNKQCTEIFKNMRINGEPSIEEEEGQWKGLPTINELKLILRFSTNLDKGALVEIIKKLEKFPQCKCEYQRIYKLIK